VNGSAARLAPSHSRCLIVGVGVLFLAVTASGFARAQQACEESPIPGVVASEAFSFSARRVSDDGRVVAFTGRSAGDPVNSRALYVFDPVTGTLRQLGAAVAPVVQTSPLGRSVFNSVHVAGLTGNGSTLFRSYFGGVQNLGSNSYLRTRNEPSYAIDVATGTAAPVPSLVANLAQHLGTPYASTILDISADGRYLLMAEAYGDGAAVPFQTLPPYRLDRLTGEVTTIHTLQQDLAPDFVDVGVTELVLSGDGQRVGFAGDRGNRLLTLDFEPTLANVARMYSEPYVLDIAATSFERAYAFDITQTRAATASSLGFLRNLGRTGTVYAFDRSGPVAGVHNPFGTASIGYVLAGQPIVQTLLAPQPWSRGTVGAGFGFISEAEDVVFFVSSENLTGFNSQLSNQLFSAAIPGGELKQITRLDDGGGRVTGLGLGSAFETAGYQTVSFRGASFDNTTVTVQAFDVDRQGAYSVTPVAGGRRSLSASFTPEPDRFRLLRVIRCPR
jgi:hypothetical protein